MFHQLENYWTLPDSYMKEKTNLLLWRTTSISHNWSDGSFLKDILQNWINYGLISEVEWMTIGSSERSVTIERHSTKDIPTIIWENTEWENESIQLSAGAESGLRWFLFGYINKMDDETGQPCATNQINFEFDIGALSSAGDYRALQKLFLSLHNAGNTDFANIHPKEDYYLSRAEQSPIDFLFEICSWANYINQDYLKIPDEFERDFSILREFRPSIRDTFLMFDCEPNSVETIAFQKESKELRRALRDCV